MTDDFEQSLRRALRRQEPGEDFAERIAARIPERVDSSDAESASVARLGFRRLMFRRVSAVRSPWLPAALAAGMVIMIGVLQIRHHAVDAARANQARTQLLQALSIASDKVNIVHAAVAREENPES